MYISKLRLSNIRCFEKLEIDFDKLRSSILLVGDNGDGKSTILRSLAMGLCDESSAAALFRELPGEFVRHADNIDEGKIEVELSAGGGYHYKIITIIKSLETFERVQQRVFRIQGKNVKKLDQDTFPWHKIFVSGYGAGIRTQGTADFQHFLAVDAVYPLFNYSVPLQNPELVVRRLVDEAEQQAKNENSQTIHKRRKDVLNEIRQLLSCLLKLGDEDRIVLSRTGIELKRGKDRSELGTLGDGYRATVTWILDLLSWWMLRGNGAKSAAAIKDIKGIVLIDEVEQHLHPRWQVAILQLLRDSFPNIQFVASTHSPLVASGCKNIPVHIFNKGQHEVIEPFGWLAEDVYREMGLESSRAKTFKELIKNFEMLDMKRLQGEFSEDDKRRLVTLRKELQSLPGTDPIALTTELKNLTKKLKRSRE